MELLTLRLLLICVGLLVSCVHGPPKDKRSGAVEVLNGENYSQEAQVLGVPILERNETVVKISGEVVFGTGISKITLKNEKVILKNPEKVVAVGATDGNGKFKLLAQIPNGDYLIELESARYKGATSVKVDRLEVSAVVLNAAVKSTQHPEVVPPN